MKLTEKSEKPLSMHPRKFALWLFMVTIVMIFASLTSAYIVRQGEGNWLIFELPVELYYSTAILLLSSVTLQWSVVQARKDNLEKVKAGLIITAALGFMFLFMQYYIWGILVDHDVYFVGNPSGSFLYVLTGIHGLHLISGLIFILIMIYAAYKYEVHSKNMARLGMCASYWHFLDGLWVYLFLFLLLNHN